MFSALYFVKTNKKKIKEQKNMKTIKKTFQKLEITANFIGYW